MKLEFDGNVGADCERPAALHETVGRRQVLGIHRFEIECLVALVQQIFPPKLQVGIFPREDNRSIYQSVKILCHVVGFGPIDFPLS